MTRRSLLSLFAVLSVSVSAWAGPLQKEAVSADAKWVVHLDVEGLIASDVGQAVLALARDKDPGLDTKIAAIAEKIGADPLKDLKGITLYGTAFDGKDGVAVIRASVNQEKLLGLLAANESHKEITVGERKAHQWVEKKRGPGDDGVRVGAFFGDDTVVIARSVEALTKALDVLDGKQSSLAADSALSPDGDKPPLFWAAVMDLPVPTAAEAAAEAAAAGAAEKAVKVNVKLPNAEFLKRVSGGSLLAGSAAGEVFGKVALIARSAEDGARIRQMVQGLVAFGQMALDAKEDDALAKQAGELLKGVKVSRARA